MNATKRKKTMNAMRKLMETLISMGNYQAARNIQNAINELAKIQLLTITQVPYHTEIKCIAGE
jgi:hypothetical protein